MHDPPHPGEFITQIFLEPNHISGRELAAKLGVAALTLNRVLKGTSNLSPEMALRLSKGSSVLLKAGWQCNTTMICGMPSNVWTSAG